MWSNEAISAAANQLAILDGYTYGYGRIPAVKAILDAAVRVDGPVFRPVPCKHGEMDEHLHEWWSERWKRWGQTECSGGEWVEVK